MLIHELDSGGGRIVIEAIAHAYFFAPHIYPSNLYSRLWSVTGLPVLNNENMALALETLLLPSSVTSCLCDLR